MFFFFSVFRRRDIFRVPHLTHTHLLSHSGGGAQQPDVRPVLVARCVHRTGRNSVLCCRTLDTGDVTTIHPHKQFSSNISGGISKGDGAAAARSTANSLSRLSSELMWAGDMSMCTLCVKRTKILNNVTAGSGHGNHTHLGPFLTAHLQGLSGHFWQQ